MKKITILIMAVTFVICFLIATSEAARQEASNITNKLVNCEDLSIEEPEEQCPSEHTLNMIDAEISQEVDLDDVSEQDCTVENVQSYTEIQQAISGYELSAVQVCNDSRDVLNDLDCGNPNENECSEESCTNNFNIIRNCNLLDVYIADVTWYESPLRGAICKVLIKAMVDGFFVKNCTCQN